MKTIRLMAGVIVLELALFFCKIGEDLVLLHDKLCSCGKR